VEWLAAEYHISFHEAFWKTSLALATVMLPIRNQRIGANGGPSYTVRASISARNKCRRFLEDHFEIIPAPAAVVGWQLGAETPLKL
jgi:hypothetical protein